jgi:predicted enzyme related to lactoylglutathione lyase
LRATVSHFEIPARDLERAARFYREVFGWRIEPLAWEGHPYFKIRDAGDGPGREGIGGGLLPREVTTDHPLLVIHLSGISLEDCLAKIVDAGGGIDKPAEEVGGMGRFARFRDPEGNVLGLWEEKGTAETPETKTT